MQCTGEWPGKRPLMILTNIHRCKNLPYHRLVFNKGNNTHLFPALGSPHPIQFNCFSIGERFRLDCIYQTLSVPSPARTNKVCGEIPDRSRNCDSSRNVNTGHALIKPEVFMSAIEFTDNYQDLSTDMGFQFKFNCERCGDGYMSTFRANTIGVVGGLLRGASSFLGGALGNIGHTAYEVQRAVGGPQHDAALSQAVEEVKPLFKKCRRCGDWVCEQVCWNTHKDMCKRCAPVAEEEENKRMSEKGKEVAAKCPECGSPTLGKKFCPQCGHKMGAAESFCRQCGVKLTPNTKFCGDCGAPVE